MIEVMTSPKIPTCTKMIGSIRDNSFVIWVILFFPRQENSALWLWQTSAGSNDSGGYSRLQF